MDYDAYISMGVKFLISKKLGVYNGKLSNLLMYIEDLLK